MTPDTLILLNTFAKSIYNKDLAYIEGQGYFLVNMQGDELTLESLDRSLTLYPEKEKDFPKVYRLNQQKSITELYRNATATIPLQGRNNTATFSEKIGEPTEAQKRLAERYNLVDFSTECLGEQKRLAKLTYLLILESVEKAELNKKSKSKIINEFYTPTLEAIKEKNFLIVENLKDDLQKMLGKQNRMLEVHQIEKAKTQIKKGLKKYIIIGFSGFIVLSFLVAFIFSYRPHRDTSEANSQAVNIDSLLNVVETENNIKIYDWRKQQIKQKLATMEFFSVENLKDSIIKFSDKNYKF